ncbi:MAG: hypothetical protein HC900_01565 [Methylacidiphilales bacterium]|nr:hypothetical protein [Candidatus Methylacidiphilales bacterium]
MKRAVLLAAGIVLGPLPAVAADFCDLPAPTTASFFQCLVWDTSKAASRLEAVPEEKDIERTVEGAIRICGAVTFDRFVEGKGGKLEHRMFDWDTPDGKRLRASARTVAAAVYMEAAIDRLLTKRTGAK